MLQNYFSLYCLLPD